MARVVWPVDQNAEGSEVDPMEVVSVARRGRWIRTHRVARWIQWRLFPLHAEEGFLAAIEEQLPSYERKSLFFFDDYKQRPMATLID
jgi:hypothetical protein